VHDLGFKAKRAEFVLSPPSFTNSRKIIITPCNYASTRNVSTVTPCIHTPTCKSSNGYSFNISLLNIKRRLFPPLSTPSHSPHFSLKLSTFPVLLNRHFLSPGTSPFSSFQIFTNAFSGSLFWFLIHYLRVLCFSLHPAPSFSITLTYFEKKPFLWFSLIALHERPL